ncbi:MAG TPA: tRNA pseudouridine(55) synthase TruB [Thermoanaerobacterales bacterium]|nr:tRNA pseudouridine(55) synthase TruB [Thermoanaerobacterales bacterium]
MNGILNILKPPGMTSHDVVSFVRKNIKVKKVGHTGTLDPGAAGVLPICIGKATKISRFIIESYKEYRAELVLGVSTDTHDNYGQTIKKTDIEIPINIMDSEINKVFNEFKGEIYQIPPMYSAIKYRGKPLYKYAREGKTVKRKERKVIIKDINIVHIFYPNRILFDVICSSGTYVRTLCNDIGEKLGCGGHMSFLIRKAVGDFIINDSILLEEFELLLNENKLDKIIYPLDYPLKDLHYAVVPDNMLQRTRNGNYIYDFYMPKNNKLKNDQFIRIYDQKNNFIAIGKLKDSGYLVPVNVLF